MKRLWFHEVKTTTKISCLYIERWIQLVLNFFGFYSQPCHKNLVKGIFFVPLILPNFLSKHRKLLHNVSRFTTAEFLLDRKELIHHSSMTFVSFLGSSAHPIPFIVNIFLVLETPLLHFRHNPIIFLIPLEETTMTKSIKHLHFLSNPFLFGLLGVTLYQFKQMTMIVQSNKNSNMVSNNLLTDSIDQFL